MPEDEKQTQITASQAASHEQTDRTIRQHLADRHWDITHSLRINHENQEFFDASINNMDWSINVALSPDFEARQQEIANLAGLDIQDAADKAIYALLEHEYGHWDISPKHIEYAEMLLDSISKGLSFAGLSEQEVKEFGPYVTNLYADILINGINYMRDERFREGNTLLLADRAYFSGGEQVDPFYEDYFALFVDVQTKLASHNDTRQLAQRYCEDYSQLEDTSRKLLEAIIGEEYAEKAFSNTLTDEDKRKIRRIMKDEFKWAQSSREFASIIAPYIKNELKDMQENISLSTIMEAMAADQEKEQEGEGQQGAKKGDRDSEEKSPGEELAKREKERIRDQVIKAGIERLGREKGGNMAGIGTGELPYASPYEVFDHIYRQRADEIVLEFMKQGEDAPRAALFHMAVRRLEEDESIQGAMAWDRTIFVGDTPMLFKREMPFPMDVSGNKNAGSFEDILFAVDVSQSMGWSGQPLDGSPYDMAIRSIYAALNYLEKSNKAQFLKYGLILFSSATTWSGWTTYGDLDTIRHQLFTGFQNGGTELNPGTVKSALDSNGERFLTIMVSDGEIYNTDSAVDACKKIIDQPNDFVLIQVDSDSYFAEKMKHSGATVVNISKPEDLVGLNLSIVDSKYGNASERRITVSKEGEESTFAKQAQAKGHRMKA